MKSFGSIKLLSVGHFGMCNLWPPLHTLPYLCNEAIINKMGLSSHHFYPWPWRGCGVYSCDSVCGLWFANLVLPSDLCAWKLGQLVTKVREASKMEVGVLVDWEPRSLESCIFTKCDHVRKGKDGLLAEGQASTAWYGRGRVRPWHPSCTAKFIFQSLINHLKPSWRASSWISKGSKPSWLTSIGPKPITNICYVATVDHGL